MVFGSMSLLVFPLAVAMGVDHQKAENNYTGNTQDHHDRLILPYQINKIGYVRIHATQVYTIFTK